MSPDDDLELPDPSEPTEEVSRYGQLPRVTWPFDLVETTLLGALYVAPFVIRWLVTP